jgi:hypothetical protein
MTSHFSYSSTYLLDKSHFSETFDQSVTLKTGKSAYISAFSLAFLGLAILLFTDISAYGAWFIVGLGALEALSVRFRKAWWLARQMLSKAANGELTLTVDENGVASHSFYVESRIAWSELEKIQHTSQGWLLYHAGGKNYVSNRCLSEQAKDFIRAKSLLAPDKLP